jgi:hypothetical protein
VFWSLNRVWCFDPRQSHSTLASSRGGTSPLPCQWVYRVGVSIRVNRSCGRCGLISGRTFLVTVGDSELRLVTRCGLFTNSCVWTRGRAAQDSLSFSWAECLCGCGCGCVGVLPCVWSLSPTPAFGPEVVPHRRSSLSFSWAGRGPEAEHFGLA